MTTGQLGQPGQGEKHYKPNTILLTFLSVASFFKNLLLPLLTLFTSTTQQLQIVDFDLCSAAAVLSVKLIYDFAEKNNNFFHPSKLP